MHCPHFWDFSRSKQAQGKIKSLAALQHTEAPDKCIWDPNSTQGEGERRERCVNWYDTAEQGQEPTFPANESEEQ